MINFNHAPELLMLLVIAFMVFGPEKLPELARGAGRGLREFRRMSSELQDSLRTTIGEPLQQVQQEMQQQVQDIREITSTSLQQPFMPPSAPLPEYVAHSPEMEPPPASVSPVVAAAQHDPEHVAPVADVPAARAPLGTRRPSITGNLGALAPGAGGHLTLKPAPISEPVPAASGGPETAPGS